MGLLIKTRLIGYFEGLMAKLPGYKTTKDLIKSSTPPKRGKIVYWSS